MRRASCMPLFTILLRQNLAARKSTTSESNRCMCWQLAEQNLDSMEHHSVRCCPQWEQSRNQVDIDFERHQQGPVQHRFLKHDKQVVTRMLRLHAAVDGRNPYVQGNLYLAKIVLDAEQSNLAEALRSYTLLLNAVSHFGPGGDIVRVCELESLLGKHTWCCSTLRKNRDIAEVIINQRLLFLAFSQVTEPSDTDTCVIAILDFIARYGRAGAVHLVAAYVRLRSRCFMYTNEDNDPDRTQWMCCVLLPGSAPSNALLGVPQIAAMLALAAASMTSSASSNV